MTKLDFSGALRRAIDKPELAASLASARRFVDLTELERHVARQDDDIAFDLSSQSSAIEDLRAALQRQKSDVEFLANEERYGLVIGFALLRVLVAAVWYWLAYLFGWRLRAEAFSGCPGEFPADARPPR